MEHTVSICRRHEPFAMLVCFLLLLFQSLLMLLVVVLLLFYFIFLFGFIFHASHYQSHLFGFIMRIHNIENGAEKSLDTCVNTQRQCGGKWVKWRETSICRCTAAAARTTKIREWERRIHILFCFIDKCCRHFSHLMPLCNLASNKFVMPMTPAKQSATVWIYTFKKILAASHTIWVRWLSHKLCVMRSFFFI